MKYFFWSEATATVLSYTKNAEEFLRRKKVHRDLIFKYLAKKGVAMPPNSEKHQLVKRTLELWSSGKVRLIRMDQFSARLSEPTFCSSQVRVRVGEKCPLKPNGSNQSRATETSVPKQMATEEDFNPQILGQQFCQWFYQLLNSQNPSLGHQPQDWGPQHFWPDVKLRLFSW